MRNLPSSSLQNTDAVLVYGNELAMSLFTCTLKMIENHSMLASINVSNQHLETICLTVVGAQGFAFGSGCCGHGMTTCWYLSPWNRALPELVGSRVHGGHGWGQDPGLCSPPHPHQTTPGAGVRVWVWVRRRWPAPRQGTSPTFTLTEGGSVR